MIVYLKYMLVVLYAAMPIAIRPLRAVLPLGREPAEQRRNAELWDDGLHFSPRGSDRVGDAVYEVMRKHGV